MHHIIPLVFTFLTTFLTHKVSACMHYRATFPYSTSLPFEATLTDDGVVVCWISMTYNQHNSQQIAFSNHHPVKSEIREVQASHTGESGSSSPTRPDTQKDSKAVGREGEGANTGGILAEKIGQDWETDEEEKGAGVWLPWEFRCLDGYQAHAGIGLRAVWYKAHGQEFEFVPGVEEDFLGEKWVYSVDLWCS